MRTLASLIVVCVFAVGAPSTAAAQQGTPTFDDLRADSHHGEKVYITDRAGATTKGRVFRISAASIALIVKDETREWATSEVKWITQRRGNTGRGALWGLIAGAAFAPVLVAFDSSCRRPYDGCGRDDAAAAFFLAPFFGGFGAAIGAAVGAVIRPEHVLYSRR